MTDPVPSKACPVCDTPDGDHLDWCTPQAREQRPSKDLVSQLRALPTGLRLLGYTAAEEIQRLQRELEAANTESINRLLQAQHFAELASGIEHLQTALRGIQSCGTCEACRGAATLALGGATPEPAVDWKARAEEAEGILSHNLALANATTRRTMNERNLIIRKLREKYSAIEIADMVGLTRQRVHQILNEPPVEGVGSSQPPEDAPRNTAYGMHALHESTTGTYSTPLGVCDVCGKPRFEHKGDPESGLLCP